MEGLIRLVGKTPFRQTPPGPALRVPLLLCLKFPFAYASRNFMPTLNWIGKEAVVNHHHSVPFRLLKDVPELSCGDPGGGNLIVQGDNLVALKALLPYYAGQVKCIYIEDRKSTRLNSSHG